MRAVAEIDVQDVARADHVRTWIMNRVKKLAARHPDMTKCRVAVATPHKSQAKGRHYRVQIGITVPGNELVATNQLKAASEKLLPALQQAFSRSERQLENYRCLRLHHTRDTVKTAWTNG